MSHSHRYQGPESRKVPEFAKKLEEMILHQCFSYCEFREEQSLSGGKMKLLFSTYDFLSARAIQFKLQWPTAKVTITQDPIGFEIEIDSIVLNRLLNDAKPVADSTLTESTIEGTRDNLIELFETG